MLCSVCNSPNTDDATACRSCGCRLTAVGGGSSTTVLQAGTKLNGGKFTVGKVLGQGGFGITYLGGDTSLGRSVAIKEFFPQGCARQGTTVHPNGAITVADYHVLRQKFLDEARVLAQFHHRGIVEVYATFEANNTAYMVMEFVKGSTLQKLVDTRGPLPEKEVVGYIAQAADALATIHQTQLLHRDIKPENLMVTQEGRVILVDFGTARAFASGKTRRMTAMLTPGYAPLEQYGQQARFGVFTDLYALGGTCYALLTGQLPVQATDRAAGIELQPPCRLNRQISQTVSDAVMWAMEMRADRRPQSAHEFIKALTGQGAKPAIGNGAPSAGDAKTVNPCESRLMQLVDELRKSPAPPPPSTHDARIDDINQKLATCASYRPPPSNHCPSCGNASLEEIAGRFTGICPLCHVGKLTKRTLDPDKCPICRNGQLGKQQLERPVAFCPICRAEPLKEECRKLLGMRLDLAWETVRAAISAVLAGRRPGPRNGVWWVCPHCRAELDLGLLKEMRNIGALRTRPVWYCCQILGAETSGQLLAEQFPAATAYEELCRLRSGILRIPRRIHDALAVPTDPHGIAGQMLGKCAPRQTWTRLAHNLAPGIGNAYCPQCQAEFDFGQSTPTADLCTPTLTLLSYNAQQFGWARRLERSSLHDVNLVLP